MNFTDNKQAVVNVYCAQCGKTEAIYTPESISDLQGWIMMKQKMGYHVTRTDFCSFECVRNYIEKYCKK